MSKKKENKSVKIAVNKSTVGYNCSKSSTKNSMKKYSLSKYAHNEEEDTYECNECEYKCQNKGRMNAHTIMHSSLRPFVCRYDGCRQNFKRSQSLKRHVRSTHLNVKPYSCEICAKRFTQSQTLKDHIYLHSTVKSFVCGVNGCQQSFKTFRYLRSHQKRRHAKRGESLTQVIDVRSDAIASSKVRAKRKPNQVVVTVGKQQLIGNLFKCQFRNCGQTFAFNELLKTHIIEHKMDEKKKSAQIFLNTNHARDKSTRDTHCSTKIDTFSCNFLKCIYKTRSFDDIADHFLMHWQNTIPLRFAK